MQSCRDKRLIQEHGADGLSALKTPVKNNPDEGKLLSDLVSVCLDCKPTLTLFLGLCALIYGPLRGQGESYEGLRLL